jgi:hypothetical protein
VQALKRVLRPVEQARGKPVMLHENVPFPIIDGHTGHEQRCHCSKTQNETELVARVAPIGTWQ